MAYNKEKIEKYYHLLFDKTSGSFAFFKIICDYRFLNINKTYEEITGISRKTITGKNVS